MSATSLSASSLPSSDTASHSVAGEIASTGNLRRGNMQQGRALEALGHALEYLIDSRMFLVDEPASSADAEAVQILASLSRAVFAECREVKPLRRRLRDWVVGRPTAAPSRAVVPVQQLQHGKVR